MDIYFGSSQNITDDLKSKFLHFAYLDDHAPTTPSEKLAVLKQPQSESIYLESNGLEILFDGYIPGLAGKHLEKSITDLAILVAGKTKVDYSNFSGLWNLCIREKQTGNIWLTSDPSAVLPLYYCLRNGDLYYCSHMHIMASVLDAGPDYAGISQKMTLGFTIGSRTLYDGMMRLNPGETISFDHASKTISSIYNTVYYTSYRHEKHIKDLIFTRLSDSFKRMRDQYDTVGLMLSEGFDSRFLGGIAKQQGFKIRSYTHITPGAGGVSIVEKVVRMLGSDHHFQSVIDGYSHDRGQLEKQLYLADNLNYPFWMPAADYFRKVSNGFPVIIGSSLDCTLGGNIFTKPSNKVWPAVLQRYTEILRQSTGLLTERYIESLSSELLEELKIRKISRHEKFISGTLNKAVSEPVNVALRSVNDHIDAELSRMKSSGSAFSSQVLQRFVLENRDRKLFFGQPLTVRKLNRIYIPSFEYGYMEAVSSVSPGAFLHHKLYIDILRRYMNEQLKIENGTYRLPPHMPRYILETARFLHKNREKKLYAELIDNKGTVDFTKFRSATIFELCGRNEKTHALKSDLLKSNDMIFNVSEMFRYIEQTRDFKIRVYGHERFYRGLEVCQVMNKTF